MKRTFFMVTLLSLLTLGPHALAQFVPLAPIPGLTDVQPTSGGLPAFFNNLYKYLIGIAAALAVIEIIWGGLLYSTTDSVGNKERGKEKIRMAIFGLVLVLSPVLVFSVINPGILNLSIGFKPIDLSVPPTTQPSTLPPCGTAGLHPPNCRQVTFEERFYVSPPSGFGAWCFQEAPQTPPRSDGTYFCSLSQNGCQITSRGDNVISQCQQYP